MQTSSFHQANAIAQSVRNELRNMQDTILDAFKENEPPSEQVINHMPHMTPYGIQPYYMQPPGNPNTHFANAMNTNIVQDNANAVSSQHTDPLLKAIELLTNKVAGLEAAQNKKPGGGKRKRNTLTHYCHTHGLCAHGMPISGVGNCIPCKSPGPNHKAEATLNNKMGGSTAFCS